MKFVKESSVTYSWTRQQYCPKESWNRELYCGFFHTADTRVATLFGVLIKVPCRFTLSIDNCREECNDGTWYTWEEQCTFPYSRRIREHPAYTVWRKALTWCCRRWRKKWNMWTVVGHHIRPDVSFAFSPERLDLTRAIPQQFETVLNLQKFHPAKRTHSGAFPSGRFLGIIPTLSYSFMSLYQKNGTTMLPNIVDFREGYHIRRAINALAKEDIETLSRRKILWRTSGRV